MPISSALLEGLRKLADIDDATWGDGSKTMTMFFRGCGAAYIADATASTTVPDDKKDLDGELVWTIYSHVHADYKAIIEDEKSGLAAWKKLKARFEKSTMSRRLKARSDFYRAVKVARKTLKGLGCEPGEVETTDVLLINLHSSWAGVRTSITSNKDEQKLEDIISILNGSTVEPVKQESDDEVPAVGLMAAASRLGSGGRRGNGGSGGGAGGGGYSGSGGRSRGHAGDSGGGRGSDDKGYHWCDPTNENHCHRCGRSGHIAARCIHDMPQHIKDWVMDNSPRERSHAAAESANEVHIFGDNEDDGFFDNGSNQYHNISAPLRI
ncbi:hypothetical protein B0H17DRAFT_1275499 [Mycena rosella]|uniref:CCHC-type domain-containing protein n=1 Tax=Mycena rosella TaxID=1033263 RepID=A0AAD7DLV8_MYCRO|nr:hypothetical protein B0H17DRAFT_1275499 [Mycena rosella]